MPEFAEELLLSGKRDAAKALNKAVKLFGKTIDFIAVIGKIEKDFNIDRRSSANEEKRKKYSFLELLSIGLLAVFLVIALANLASPA